MASTRSCGSLGPPISGRGRMDGTSGTAAAEPRPLASNRSSASPSPPSGSFSSQTPTASAPAAVYVWRSSAKLEVSVVICEIENRRISSESRLLRRWSQRRTRKRRGRRSSFATIVPEPAPRPGPGQVLAPMWKTPSTGVRCPGWAGNGRHRKFWSSASEPP